MSARFVKADWETISQALALLDDASENTANWRDGEDETGFAARVLVTRRKVQERLEPKLRRCTCGGSDYASCLCNLTPREWLAYAKTNPLVDQGLRLSKGMRES